MNQSPRDTLLELYTAAIQAVHGDTCVQSFLKKHPMPDQPITLLAMGKAAAAMARAACDVLGDQVMAGLVVTKEGHADASLPSNIDMLEAAHPVPDERSLLAGKAVVELVKQLPVDNQLLVLTSGGASALVDALPDGLELSDLARLNQWLLGSGLAIQDMNHIRQSISLIKGGGLAKLLRGQSVINLLISDVPDDDLAVIGSGPFFPALTLQTPTVPLPDWLVAMQEQARSGGSVMEGEVQAVAHYIVASNSLACKAAVRAALQSGLKATYHEELLEGDVETVVSQLVRQLDTLSPGVHVWGGETTVKLPPQPGRGGRNQHFALATARHIAGRNNVWLLAAGTDGTDGPTEDAGALVDGGTVSRGELEGLEVTTSLAQADAGTFLEASGDLLHTGPTGTNVMDIVIVWKNA